MMLAPRWRKVLRDIVRNPTRTVLVIVSIAVGVVAVAMVVGGYAVIESDLPASFQAINPAEIVLDTDPFEDDLIESIARMPEVEDAAGLRRISVQARVGDSRWQDLRLVVIDDFEGQSTNIVQPEEGAWPPGKAELLVERSSVDVLDARSGQPLTIKMPDDQLRDLTVVGLAHDLNEIAANFTGIAYGYITFDTLEKLGEERTYNQLAVRVAGDNQDRERNEEIAQAVADKVEKAGVTVWHTNVPRPGEHQMEQFLTPMLIILGAMGVLSLLLSGFLVVNIITALLAQQTRQIGVMKAVGAQSGQIAGMYLAMVLVYGLLALVIALPLGAVVTHWFAGFAAGLMNFDIHSAALPVPIVALLVVIGLGVPVIAALIPIRRGARITVREAIGDYGAGTFGQSRFDRLLERLQGVSRPLLISLRNTFRKRGRLALTLITLTLASAIFISVFGVRASLYRTMADAFAYWNYDINVDFSRPYRADYLEQIAREMPGVKAAEAWGFRNVTRQRPDDSESDQILLIAPQPATELLSPTLLEGRWLLPEDENAVVINSDLLDDEPDLAVGDTIVLNVGERETEWVIVGLVRSVMAGPFAYANYPWFAESMRAVGQANTLNIALEDGSPASQRAALPRLEKAFKDLGLQVSSAESTVQRQERVKNQFGVLILFLAIMALTLAIVGGLGLMGTMSINVLERRREIGILRSIGASTHALMQIVIVEGILIGVISWTIGALLAIPLSKVLSDAVGAGFINSALTYAYSYGGAAFWLAVMAGIAALASFLPARQAARLTVREVLAYE